MSRISGEKARAAIERKRRTARRAKDRATLAALRERAAKPAEAKPKAAPPKPAKPKEAPAEALAALEASVKPARKKKAAPPTE